MCCECSKYACNIKSFDAEIERSPRFAYKYETQPMAKGDDGESDESFVPCYQNPCSSN